MTEAQYCQTHNEEEDEEEEEEHGAVFELSSSQLSMEDESESDFDADDCFDVLEKLAADQADVAVLDGEKTKEVFKISGEGDLAQLMNMPAHKILGSRPQQDNADGPPVVSEVVAKKMKLAK